MRNEADLTVITATMISSVILVDNPHHAITMTTTSTVQGIKTALSKELPCDELSDDSLERCRDLLQRLDELPIDLKVLQKTLVGTVVSKFKTHETLGPMAKSLVKKWKKMAKQGVASTAPAQANDSTDANALAEMEAEICLHCERTFARSFMIYWGFLGKKWSRVASTLMRSHSSSFRAQRR